jgi:hypothetical protein
MVGIISISRGAGWGRCGSDSFLFFTELAEAIEEKSRSKITVRSRACCISDLFGALLCAG